MKFKYPTWHRLHKQQAETALYSPADKSGLPPGSLVHIGEIHQTECKISLIQYNLDSLAQHEITSVAELNQFKGFSGITWININGLNDTSIVEAIGQEFNIHPLVLEDILSTHQRPKLEEYDDYLYLVVKGITTGQSNNFTLMYEQISILLLADYVITFKEKSDDTFKHINHRLKKPNSHLRRYGGDYLTYVILDTIVDEYFVVQDNLDEIIIPIEDSVISNPTETTLPTIQLLRRELISINRNIAPLRELLTTIQRSDTMLINENILRYFNDVYDHVLRVTDIQESYRERITAMQEIYLTSISNKMNETMKVLTVFASIFIPLTFIAGIYGMNFDYMPELKWRWAYPALWLIFFMISAGLLVYFRKKKWL